MKQVVFGLYILLILLLGVVTFVEKKAGTEYVSFYIYGSWWFPVLWGVLAVGSFSWMCKRKLIRKPAVWLLHFSFLVILAGALLTFLTAERGVLHLRQGRMMNVFRNEQQGRVTLPVSVRLDTFYVECYPGTPAPSDYVSCLTVFRAGGQEKAVVSMNRIYHYGGYRFYQSSFDEDGRGSWLMVNCDPWGIAVTYAGYILMALAMLSVLFSARSRFRQLLQHSFLCRVIVLIGVGVGMSTETFAIEPVKKLPALSLQEAEDFGRLQVVYNDRQAPVHTLARDFTFKLTGKASWKGLTSGQVMSGWLFFPEIWQKEPMLEINNKELQRLLGCGVYAAVIDLFAANGNYRLAPLLVKARKHGQQNALDKSLIGLDEKVQLIIMLQQGTLLKMFPDDNGGQHRWYTPTEPLPASYTETEQRVVQGVFSVLKERLLESDTGRIERIIRSLHLFQQKHGKTILLPAMRVQAEIFYNCWSLSDWLFKINLFLGVLALIFFLSSRERIPRIFFVLLTIAVLVHTLNLILRIYISSRLPFGNGYETMLFMAWFVMLLPLFFYRRFQLLIAFGFLFSGFALLVAHLIQMNPQISPLVPVLSSSWLSIHVSLIMMSYALLGVIALNSLTSFLILVFSREGERSRILRRIERLAVLSRIFLYPGVFLLGAGIFIGAVWANVSWGRYWGWDPKEVWALITFMVYALAFHSQSLKLFASSWTLHVFMFSVFFLVLMTYFGVNYFLGGMHSYAGTAELNTVLLPVGLISGGIFLLIFLARIRYKNIQRGLER